MSDVKLNDLQIKSTILACMQICICGHSHYEHKNMHIQIKLALPFMPSKNIPPMTVFKEEAEQCEVIGCICDKYAPKGRRAESWKMRVIEEDEKIEM